MADPWMKFYTSDWRSDPRLKMCSAGARGVWIEMICLMHEATPYGHLLVYGQPPNEAQLASLTGIPLAELNDYIAELGQMGVFSRTKEGVIYSRKLVRMAAKSAKARKSGKMGGNPSLLKQTEKQSSLKGRDNGGDKPQKPEARSQSKKRDTNVSPKKGTRLSQNWVLPKDWGDWASSQGFDDGSIRIEAEKFRDYWVSKSTNATKLDWLATWRNWIRNASPQAQRPDASKQLPADRSASQAKADDFRRANWADGIAEFQTGYAEGGRK